MTEKKFLPACLFKLLCMSLLLISCGESVHEEGVGTITAETRNVGAFFNLDIDGNYDIVLQEGSNPLITVETDENLHQYVETTLDGQTLKIRDIENVEPSEQTRLIITYQKIESILLKGAVTLKNQGVLDTEELKLKINGAGVVELSLRAREFNLILSGSGSVNLRGKAGQQKMEMSGAGNVAAFELESKDCEIDLSGVGSAQVFVTKSLNAEVSGVGSIRFKGDPQNITRKVNGIGVIERVE